MANAGRILILARGAWSATTNYVQLDLVTQSGTAYLARAASIGVDPSTDSSYTYWQPFGSAAQIATTSAPGLVMPDGTTITVDNTGLIQAALGVSDLSNVSITSLADTQVLRYNTSSQKWENKSLGSAAVKNSTNAVTQSSTDLVESGAVYSEISSVSSALSNKADSSTVTALSTTVSNNVKVTSFQVSTSSWSSDTTSQSGTTLYKKSVALSHVYVDSPLVKIGAASGSVLPTTAQQEAYDLIQYATLDGTTLYLYASAIPTSAFYINVEGVD